MFRHIIFIATLAQIYRSQDVGNFNPEVVSEWSSGQYLDDGNKMCIEDCNKTCVQKCPVPDLCKEDEIQCGKKDLPAGVWFDCIKDDVCVPKGCECKDSINDIETFFLDLNNSRITVAEFYISLSSFCKNIE